MKLKIEYVEREMASGFVKKREREREKMQYKNQRKSDVPVDDEEDDHDDNKGDGEVRVQEADQQYLVDCTDVLIDDENQVWGQINLSQIIHILVLVLSAYHSL